ncbi:MAG: ribonuclease P protein subunit [Nanoarchaeota archaeon]
MNTELIGKKIKIIESNNKSIVGKTGIIVDETMNMLSIEMNGKEIKVIKDQCVFEIDGEKVMGKEIAKKPEERIKK